jgi:hypothetical protein
VKELLKKQTEVSHLLRFRQKLPAFPDGMVCVGEAPDFFVNIGHGYVGIEHTQWFRESGSRGGSRMCAREGKEDKILRLALSRVMRGGDYLLSGSTSCGVSGTFPPLGYQSSQTPWPISRGLSSRTGRRSRYKAYPPRMEVLAVGSKLSIHTPEKDSLEESLGPHAGCVCPYANSPRPSEAH